MINFYKFHRNKLDQYDLYANPFLIFDEIINGYRLECDGPSLKNDKILPIRHIIKKSPRYAFLFARNVIEGRWVEAEPYIMKDPYYVFSYARDIIKGRWYEAEADIITNTWRVQYYAEHIIKDRWIEAEPIIIKDSYRWDLYKKRFNI